MSNEALLAICMAVGTLMGIGVLLLIF